MTDALVDRGNAIKEEMFGPEHGAAKLEQATDFTRPFEELVCTYCFAEVWGRDQELSRRIRSMLTIAILVAQGRREQKVRVHVKGAIANGVTTDEIRVVLLHAVVYCGVPAAVNGYRNAAQALEEIGLS
jgi:4-carboxymuconolactone decarboxylase